MFSPEILRRLALHGLVHCDFNEFNLMVDQSGQVTLIDFPQVCLCYCTVIILVILLIVEWNIWNLGAFFIIGFMLELFSQHVCQLSSSCQPSFLLLPFPPSHACLCVSHFCWYHSLFCHLTPSSFLLISPFHSKSLYYITSLLFVSPPFHLSTSYLTTVSPLHTTVDGVYIPSQRIRPLR